MKVVVILPTFNERDNIITLLDLLHVALNKVKSHDIHYLVVDDNSPDNTKLVVEDYQRTHNHIHIISGKKEGLGRALLRGMRYAISTLHADILVQMDADLSHDPKVVPLLIHAIDDGADMAVGSRYIPGGSIPNNWGLHRKIFSIIGNSVVRYGLGFLKIHDWTGGFRAYKSSISSSLIDSLQAYNGYVFQIAFLHKSILTGAKIVEIPIHFTDRKYGKSKIAPSIYIRNIFEYVFKARIQSIIHGSFGKFCVVGGIGFIINTVILELFVRLHIHPSIGSAVGAECAIISNFLLNNNWTFKKQSIKGNGKFGKFIQFNTTSLGAILIQTLTVWIGSILFGVHGYRYYYILGVAIGLVWNYWMYSHVIWKTH